MVHKTNYGKVYFFSNIAVTFEQARRCSPVDCRPSSDEPPPIGKINSFSKIAITLEPVVPFRCPSRFKHLQPLMRSPLVIHPIQYLLYTVYDIIFIYTSLFHSA